MNSIIKDLERLVKIDSRYGNENNSTETFKSLLIKAGFAVKSQKLADGRVNLYAVKNPHNYGRALLFYGHQDTVDIADDWSYEPRALTIKENKAYGLGAFDMKGGIMAFLAASTHSSAYIKIFLAVDEENISEGGWHAVQTNRTFFEDVALVISAEPSLTDGSTAITVGRTGRFLFDVTFKGKSAHLANYKDGIDAIERLHRFLGSFYAQREQLFDAQGSTAQIRSIQSEVIGMSVPELASCQAEVLANVKQSIEVVERLLQKLAGKNGTVSLTPRKTPYLPGYSNETFEWQHPVEKTIREVYGKPIRYIERRSVGDDNVLASIGLPVITWGPEGGNAHSADEWVDLGSLEKLTSGYKKLLQLLESQAN